MKPIITPVKLLLLLLLISATSLAQVPQMFKYQAVLRDSGGDLKANQDVSVTIRILQGSASGTQVYTESFSPTTTNQGLIHLTIGANEDLRVVDWAAGPYFLEVTVDATLMGTSQLLAVPYALKAETVAHEQQDLSLDGQILTITGNDEATPIDLSTLGGTATLAEVLNEGNQAGDTTISQLADPVYDQDAATKAYIDRRLATLENVLISHGFIVEDVDGNRYGTVTIGNQVWMAENLRVTHYADGRTINEVTENAAWLALADNSIDKAYCWVNNDPQNEYGILYTWAAATDGTHSESNPSNVQGICPEGWHLPSYDEWFELINYAGGNSDAGGKLKEAGLTHWASPNTDATDDYHFTALPAGYRTYDGGNFTKQGKTATFWSTEEVTDYGWDGTGAKNVMLFFDKSYAQNNMGHKSAGKSVRCIKD